MSPVLPTISRIPAKQAVLNNPRSVAVFLSYLHPLELIGKDGVQTTCKQFHASLVLAIKHFVRTAHVIDKFNNKPWSIIRMIFTFLQKRDVVQRSAFQKFLAIFQKKDVVRTMADVFSTMEQVRRLSLSGGNDTLEILFQPREFRHLTHLSFDCLYYADSEALIQVVVKKCPHLQSLRMPIFGKADYSPLCALQQLESVDIGDHLGLATDETLETLSKVTSLTHVGLADCSNITHVGVDYLLRAMPRLSSLNISGHCGPTNNSESQALIPEAISLRGKNITHLDMSCGYFFPARIREIISSCTQLQRLNLSPIEELELEYHKRTSELAANLRFLNPRLTVNVVLRYPKRI